MVAMRSVRSRLFLAALVLAACSDDDLGVPTPTPGTDAATTVAGSIDSTPPTTAAPAQQPCGGTIEDPAVSAMASDPELSSMVALIAAAGLTETLNGPGPFTILAPTNGAFQQLLPQGLDATVADQAVAADLVNRHVIEGARLSSTELLDAGTATAVGGDLTFAGDGSALIVNDGAATVTCADLVTTNATVHVIDTVLPAAVDETAAVGGTRLYSVDLTTGAATVIGPIGEQLGVLGLAIAPGEDASTVYGLTDTPELVTFDAADPATLTSSVPVTGVAAGSTLLAIDVRPATGELLAISDAGVLYIIDPATGAASAIGQGIGQPLADPGIGFDVDPTSDLIRLTVATGETVRLDPETGVATIDATPAYGSGDANAGAAPRLVAAAYTAEVADARLFVVDTATGNVAVQTPSGVLATLGALGVDVTDGASFDIAASGEALVASPG
jgi:uncharacterized surface protein with fasciclin (FAS1) repeats